MKAHYLTLFVPSLIIFLFTLTYCTKDDDSSSKGEVIGHWPLDEISGTAVSDISGNQQTGSIVNLKPIWSLDGKNNGCLDFSNYSLTSHIQIAKSDILNLTDGPFSIALWMKAAKIFPVDAYLIQKGTHENIPDDEVSNGKWFGIQVLLADYEYIFRFSVDDDANKTIVTANPDHFLTDEWVHVVAIRDTNEHKLKLYRDGVLLNEVTDYTGSIACDTNLIIGNRSTLDDPFWGKLDEVLLFDYALNDDQVLSLYSGTIP
jgi:hypothetical protein